MQALWLEGQRLAFVGDLPDPMPGPGEALIRVLVAGICNTDLEMARGYYPFTGVPGHEFVGRVVACPDSALMGKRVCGEITLSCGLCEECRAGRRSHCQRSAVLGMRGRNGCFAEYLTLPLENLHPVPEAISDEQATFVEPLAAALEIGEQVQVRPSDRIVVVGEGKLGNLAAQVLAPSGAWLMVIGRHAHKLELLAKRGIHVGYPGDVNPRMADLVVECTGSPSGFELARRAVRPRGTIVLKSTYRGEVTANFSTLVVDEVTLVGSRCGPFRPALDLLEAGRVEVLGLVSARYPLEQGVRAFDHAASPGTLKVLLQPPR